MKFHFYLLAVLALMSGKALPQCTFTTNVSASGPTVGCGTLTLSAGTNGDAWVQETSMSIGRENAVAFSIGTKGYIGTGDNGSGYLNDFWEYDPATNAWSQKANFAGTARYGAVGFGIGANGYIGTGLDNNGTAKNDFWMYSPTTNTWTQKANASTTSRYQAIGFELNGKGYLGMGVNSISLLSDFYEYDPATDTWAQKTAFSGGARKRASAFSAGGYGYVGLGETSANAYNYDFYQYNVTSDSWTQKASYGGPGGQTSAGFGIGSKGYLFAGLMNASETNTLWEYNTVTDHWIQRTSVPASVRERAVAFVIGNDAYCGTGYPGNNNPHLSDLWKYTPAMSYSWSTGSTLQAIPVSATGLYSYTVTNNLGCTGSASQSVNLTPNPTVSVGGAGLTCSGAGNTLTASGAATYTWSSNAGSSNSASVAVSPASTTVYTVSGTTNGCTVSYPATVSIVELPVATLTAVGPFTTCGTPVSLSVNIGPSNTWTQKFGLNDARTAAVAFNIGGKGYVGTGYDGNMTYNDLWEFDPVSNTWTQKANIGGPSRYGATGFAIGAKGYIGTGVTSTGTLLADFWEYDPAVNSWTAKTAFAGSARKFAGSFSIGAKGYIAVGYDGSDKNDLWEYNQATNGWTQRANLSVYREQAFSFAVNGKGYIGAGAQGSTYYNDVYEYNPATNTWASKSGMGSSGRYGAAAFTLGSKAYVNGGSAFNDFWEYTPATDSWVQKANFGGSYRWNPVAFGIGSKGYIGTGSGTSSYYSDFWEYDPGSSIAWSTGSPQPTITATASDNYSLTVTNAFGCVSTASQAVSVIPVPTLALSGATGLCNGDSGTLTASGASTYTWSSSAGNATTASVAITPSVTDVYSLTGAANGCTTTAARTVTVFAIPSVSASTSTTSVCQGASVTLSGSGANVYVWSGGVSDNSPFAPSATADYTVTGTDVNSCSNTAVVSVTVLPSPTVTVNSGSICAGESFTLSPGGALTYSYSGGSSVVSPSVTTGYSVTGFNAIGCPNAIPAIATVTAFSLPAIVASSTIICIGNSYTFTPSGASTYTYSGGSAVVSPTSNATYSITGTSTAGCLGSAVVSLTVSALPVISAGGGTLCSGQSFTLNPSGASTYTYSGGSAIVSPGVNASYSVSGTDVYGCVSASPAIASITVMASPTVTINSGSICAGQSFTLSPSGAASYSYQGGSAVVSPVSTANYSVIGFNANGCSALNPVIATVTVNSLPVISANGASICAGSSYTLLPGGASTYTYSGGSQIVTPSSTTTYSISGTDNAGCVSAAPAVIEVTVNALPVVSVNSGTVCSGYNFVIVPSGAATYSYSGGSATVAPSVNSSYSVTGISSEGCISAAPAIASVSVITTPTITLTPAAAICSGNSYTIQPSGAATYSYSGGSNVVTPSVTTTYTVSGSVPGCQANLAIITISVQPTLTVSINSPTQICQGQSVTLVASGAASYTWNNGINGNSITANPAATFVFSVTASSAGCFGSATRTVDVEANPMLITFQTNSVLCLGETGTISVTGAASFLWSNGSTSAEISVTPPVSVIYTVTGLSATGCTSSVTVMQSVSDCLGINPVEQKSNRIIVYPNPNNGKVTIETEMQHEDAVAELYNNVGQLVISKPLQGAAQQLDYADLPNGLYILQVVIRGQRVSVSKMVKQ